MPKLRADNWSVSWGNTVRVRRWVYTDKGKKLEGLPAKTFKHLLGDRKALEDFVVRLNNKNPDAVRLKEKLDIRHAFISPKLLMEYFEYLTSVVPDHKNATRNFGYLQTHVLNYFINTKQLQDPVDWLRAQIEWGKYLTSKRYSSHTIKQIVVEANRFIQWLHNERPSEVKFVRFEPLNRHVLKKYRAERKVRGEDTESQYVPIKVFQDIFPKIRDERVKAAAWIAYNYGLREGEICGLMHTDIRKSCLKVERQLDKLPRGKDPTYKSVKGREERKVPHWNTQPIELAHKLKQILSNLITAGTLGRLWSSEMQRLGYSYRFHDLRHGFITNALRTQVPIDVMHAVGHKDLSTTMQYLHDDREFEDLTVFDPAA